MAQQVRRRYQKTIKFSANNKSSEDLSRGMVYRELHVRLRGQPTLTAVNNTQGNTGRGDEWGVVKKIEVVANNTETLWSIDGNALWWLNYFMFGARPRVTPTLGDAATANPTFDSVLILPFWMPQAIRPIDTALDARKLSDLKVEITWGTFTDVNSAATAWTTEPSLEVHSLESFNLATESQFSSWRVYAIEKEISATNSKFQVQLPVGPMYRGFLMNFTDAGSDDADVLNNFKFISGTTTYADVKEEVLRQVQSIRYNNQRSFTGQVYDDDRISTKNSVDGWYFYDHVTDGFLSESVDSLGFSELELELDVTVGGGATKAIIYPFQVLPVRGR